MKHVLLLTACVLQRALADHPYQMPMFKRRPELYEPREGLLQQESPELALTLEEAGLTPKLKNFRQNIYS